MTRIGYVQSAVSCLTNLETGNVQRLKDENLLELKEDRNLFAHLAVVAKSKPNINVEEAVGKCELQVVPRSLFAADGQMLHCSTKSNLMILLGNLPK